MYAAQYHSILSLRAKQDPSFMYLLEHFNKKYAWMVDSGITASS